MSEQIEELQRQAIIAKPVPDPRRLEPAITGEIKTVLDTALAKDRDHRYQKNNYQQHTADTRKTREYNP